MTHRATGLLLVILWTVPVYGQDAIPLSSVRFVGPGGDLGAFAIATTIRRVDIRLNGVEVQFDKRDGPGRWPDHTTPGWAGPLQYSLGLVLNIQGQWYASAPIETWYGANVIGGPIQEPGQIPMHWFYDQRWGAMQGYQPRIGETLGVFVVAGDPRNSYTPVRERSNIVLVTMPAPQTTASVTFEAPAPAPPVPPFPTDVDARLEQLAVNIRLLQQQLAHLTLRVEGLEARPIPMACRVALRLGVTRIPLSCTLQ